MSSDVDLNLDLKKEVVSVDRNSLVNFPTYTLSRLVTFSFVFYMFLNKITKLIDMKSLSII